jgi:hypothetical protein
LLRFDANAILPEPPPFGVVIVLGVFVNLVSVKGITGSSDDVFVVEGKFAAGRFAFDVVTAGVVAGGT